MKSKDYKKIVNDIYVFCKNIVLSNEYIDNDFAYGEDSAACSVVDIIHKELFIEKENEFKALSNEGWNDWFALIEKYETKKATDKDIDD